MHRFIAKLHAHLQTSARTQAYEKSPMRHKEYPRFPRHALPEPDFAQTSFADVLFGRSSARPFSPGTISKDALASALRSVGMRGKHDLRTYPSGGGLFPIETYVLAFAVEGLPRRVFHYHPTAHALEEMWDLDTHTPLSFLSSKEDHPAGNLTDIAALIVLTSAWQRTTQKYGDFGYPLALLEAGHMGQNMLLAAHATHLAARPFGRIKGEALSSLLDLDPNHEQSVYTIGLSSCQ